MVKSKVDPCIFCGNAPCTCNSKPVRRKVKTGPSLPATESVEAAPVAPPRTSHLDAMRAAAASAPPRPTAPAEPVKSAPVTDLTDEEIIFNAAIRNLAPLLCEADREQYSGIITSKPHPDEAKIMWKARRKTDA